MGPYLTNSCESSTVQNMAPGIETVTVECKKEEGNYYVTEGDGPIHIFTVPLEKIYFTLNNVSKEHPISIEVKYDNIDRSDIILCDKCKQIFCIDEEDTSSFILKGSCYSKCKVVKLIEDEEMKIPISFLCLTSHHQRQEMFYKLIFEQEEKLLGSFLVKVSKNSKRDFDNFTNSTKKKKRNFSESEDGPSIMREPDSNCFTCVVVPKNNDARMKLIAFANEHNGRVQELLPGPFL